MKTKQIKTAVFLSVFIAFGASIYANGLVLSNLHVDEQNTSEEYQLINFDIAWNNSWRTSEGQSNWDACWVFVKWRRVGGDWNHATIHSSGYIAPSNSTIVISADNKGAMIYSANDMDISNVNYTGAKLRWDYGIDGLAGGEAVEISVFAIEMVYVPEGSFYVGDGTSNKIAGHFENGTSGAPFQIISEEELTLGGGADGNLGNNNTDGMAVTDDFNDSTSKTLPKAYPKGFKGFYCMKYEISQEQYVTFLNKLTYRQQAARTVTPPMSAAGTGALETRNIYQNGIDIMTPSVDSIIPAIYACNLDGDRTYNEVEDGQNLACNYLSWADVAAYLDWAALRPITELEFEKACRGNQPAVANEYSWGKISLNKAKAISNRRYNKTGSNSGLKKGTITQSDLGASYMGIMELSGNIWERCVTVGNKKGRDFTSTHGDGALNTTGNADASTWPEITAVGVGFRGGNWANVKESLRVSDRYNASYSDSSRFESCGARGVRCLVP